MELGSLGGLQEGLGVQRKMSALVKGENGWWMSRDLELGLEGRGGVERHLTGVQCDRIVSLGSQLKDSQPLTVHEWRVHESVNNSRTDCVQVDRHNRVLLPREMQEGWVPS